MINRVIQEVKPLSPRISGIREQTKCVFILSLPHRRLRRHTLDHEQLQRVGIAGIFTGQVILSGSVEGNLQIVLFFVVCHCEIGHLLNVLILDSSPIKKKGK